MAYVFRLRDVQGLRLLTRAVRQPAARASHRRADAVLVVVGVVRVGGVREVFDPTFVHALDILSPGMRREAREDDDEPWDVPLSHVVVCGHVPLSLPLSLHAGCEREKRMHRDSAFGLAFLRNVLSNVRNVLQHYTMHLIAEQEPASTLIK